MSQLLFLQNTKNLVISRCFLQRTAKKCTKIQNARAQSLFCSLNLLFGVAIVTVAVVVCKNSLVFGERRHRIKKYPDSPVSHVIGFMADIFSSTLESEFIFLRIRCQIRRISVDGSHIRNEKVADSKLSGYVWTGPKSV